MSMISAMIIVSWFGQKVFFPSSWQYFVAVLSQYDAQPEDISLTMFSNPIFPGYLGSEAEVARSIVKQLVSIGTQSYFIILESKPQVQPQITFVK